MPLRDYIFAGSGRDSKGGAGPVSTETGASQGRAVKVATATLERLTESLPLRKNGFSSSTCILPSALSIRGRSQGDDRLVV